MYYFKIYLFGLLLFLTNAEVYSQVVDYKTPLLTLEGEVLDVENFKPIHKVSIQVLGGEHTQSNLMGEFKIRARIGDELIISSQLFNTIYYTVKTDDDIKIEVHPEKSIPFNKQDLNALFTAYIDKAINIYPTDHLKGIDQITAALELGESQPLSDEMYAKAYAVLGDIYRSWKQPDLAISNYVLSLRNSKSIEVEAFLAKAYFENKDYAKVVASVSDLLKQQLNGALKLDMLVLLGDAHSKLLNYEEALKTYNDAIASLPKKDKILAQAQIKAKIAQVLQSKGALSDSKTFALESIEELDAVDTLLLDKVKNKVVVADVFNSSKSYDAEIRLRKEVVASVMALPDTLNNTTPITIQKQAYKIANAYATQEQFDNAIPYLKKSAKVAVEKGDIVIAKNAQRKLSEVYKYKGDYQKALDAYTAYVKLVDEDYIKKEQEIYSAKRLAENLAKKQNRIEGLERDRELNEQRYKIALTAQELNVSRSNTQKAIITGLIIAIILLGFVILAVYKSNKRKEFSNNLLALKGLRTQMNPHFIFNALNSVNSFIATNDERTANRYLSDFSSLMRSVLDYSEEDFIPLAHEIELLERYIKLEHFRFSEKFDYEIIISPGLDLKTLVIPPMLIQPYVENAVWHGMRYIECKGKIKISFDVDDEGDFKVVISDNGIGRKASKALKTENQKKHNSKGLANIKKRIAILNKLYNYNISTTISDLNQDSSGTVVTLRFKNILS